MSSSCPLPFSLVVSFFLQFYSFLFVCLSPFPCFKIESFSHKLSRFRYDLIILLLSLIFEMYYLSGNHPADVCQIGGRTPSSKIRNRNVLVDSVLRWLRSVRCRRAPSRDCFDSGSSFLLFFRSRWQVVCRFVTMTNWWSSRTIFTYRIHEKKKQRPRNVLEPRRGTCQFSHREVVSLWNCRNRFS